MKKIYLLFSFIFFYSLNVAYSNNYELFIEALNEKDAYDIKGGEECNPGDIIITIKSDIQNLNFDSNIMDIESVFYNPDKGEYIFCHSNESFWLTVASDNHISKKVYIDGNNTKYAFKVVEKSPTGKIYVKTLPNNAFIDFGFSGQSPQLSAYPIEMNSGEYKIRISKNGYQSLDTIIIVPSDGSTAQVSVSLKPLFGKIFVDISSKDNENFQIMPIIDIDTTHINLADLKVKEKLLSFDASDNIQYFRLYEGGYIPVPPGSYNITVSSPGYKTYNTQLFANKGTTTQLTARMDPLIGYLTLIDDGNSEAAEAFINGKSIGTLPIFKHTVRVGEHKLRLSKVGYITNEEEYSFKIEDQKEVDLPVKMFIFREFDLHSEPSGAEIMINGKRRGFTPLKVSLAEGEHELIIRKHGMLDFHKKIIIDANSITGTETIAARLETTKNYLINAEKDSLKLVVKRKKEILYSNLYTPGKVLLPAGKYQMSLYEKKKKRFSGKVKLDKHDEITLPSYSRGTFTSLMGDLYLPQQNAISPESNYYSLLASANFGRFNIFPGFHTSIIKASAFQLKKEFLNTVNEEDGYKLSEYLIGASPLFLNWEMRLGGAVLKQLDVALIGTYAWYPSLTNIESSDLKTSEWGFHHISGHEGFLGLEFASRISAFNLNIKIGQEIFKGDYVFHYYKDKTRRGFIKTPFEVNNLCMKVGFTLGQKPSKGNNMIRLWYKPIVSNY